MAVLDLLVFLDGLAAGRARRDLMFASAVASGVVTAPQAWPEFFPGGQDEGAFPSSGADTSGFVLEQATPESFAADIAALAESSRRVTVREPSGGPSPGHEYVPDAEWT